MLVTSNEAPCLAVSLAIGIVISILGRQHLQRIRDRAAARDHAVELPRGFAIPLRCVNCDSPHAPFSFRVRCWSLNESNRTKYDFSIQRHFRFHYCLRCIRAARRRRMWGWAAAAGALFAFALLPLYAIVGFSSVTRSRSADSLVTLAVVGIAVSGGTALTFLAYWLFNYTPAVSILDLGNGRMVLRFRSQLFRTAVAELNGAEPASPSGTA